MTTYSDLERKNRIKKGQFTQKQVQDCIDLAIRDIGTAEKLLDDSTDWCFNIAYNSMLQAIRAFMFQEGYRATGMGQHETTILFAQISLEKTFKSTLDYMDRMRRKRHRSVYDTAGLVSHKEA